MKNLAEFTIIGRIGKINAGDAVTRLSIASNYRRKGKDGEWGDDTHWNQVVVFSESTRNYIAEHVAQGDLVMARGRIRESSYEKDGHTRYGVDLICTSFGLLAGKQPAAPQPEDDDIPF